MFKLTRTFLAAFLLFSFALTATVASAAPIGRTTLAATCAPAWKAAATYTAGNLASDAGHNYKANWWNQNDRPSTSASGAWADQGVCTPPTITRTPTPRSTPTAAVGGTISRIGMYYPDWNIYDVNYQPKRLETSGTAAKLTDLYLAFGNVTNGKCVMGDPYADYQKLYGAAASVNGTADTNANNAGVIHQLAELKAKHPKLRVFWSFGGWTWSDGFAQAAAHPATFATSCWNLLNDPRWTKVFDGIDIDWEYPNACGLTCDNSGRNAFKNLMAALWNSPLRNGKLVSAAIGADGTPGGKLDQTDYLAASAYVHWFNVMTYDYFGTWDATGPTAPHSPLNNYSGIPITGANTKSSITYLRNKGIPASKLSFGIGFYGRGWTGVTQAAPGGSATGPANGSLEPGMENYNVLINSCPPTSTVGGTSYAFCGNNWWSYDTATTIASKLAAMKAAANVTGVFVWEASGDTPTGALITVIYNNK